MSAASESSDTASSLIEALNAVAMCVTDQRLYAQPRRFEPGLICGVAFGRDVPPVPLRAKSGGPSGLMLDIVHTLVIAGDSRPTSGSVWHATTIAYEYRILDRHETDLLVYHWQPSSIARGPDFPHMHVSAALTAQVTATVSQRFPLDKRHVPTGIVTLADVVRMLIAEFGIAERHRDWPARLTRAEIIFRRSFVADV